MVVPLREATADTCGAKAATLAVLLRAGFPVPDGVVVPFGLADRIFARGPADTTTAPDPARELSRTLDRFGDRPVAVRSSAADEDRSGASSAGQYDSVLGVRGRVAIVEAIGVCLRSTSSARVRAYRGTDRTSAAVRMAVIVQDMVEADLSGVMFTPTAPDADTLIEAAGGSGGVVGGLETPQRFRVARDGRVDARIVPSTGATLPDRDAVALARLGGSVAELLGGPRDIEWAIADHRIYLLQARPITAVPPPVVSPPAVAPPSDVNPGHLVGTAAGAGYASGPARVVRDSGDFAHVRPGDVLVCPLTDPAWTPLLRIAAAVVTDVGGVLSHAAIVARELGIPAVLGVPNATRVIRSGEHLAVDGTSGVIRRLPPTDHLATDHLATGTTPVPQE